MAEDTLWIVDTVKGVLCPKCHTPVQVVGRPSLSTLDYELIITCHQMHMRVALAQHFIELVRKDREKLFRFVQRSVWDGFKKVPMGSAPMCPRCSVPVTVVAEPDTVTANINYMVTCHGRKIMGTISYESLVNSTHREIGPMIQREIDRAWHKADLILSTRREEAEW